MEGMMGTDGLSPPTPSFHSVLNVCRSKPFLFLCYSVDFSLNGGDSLLPRGITPERVPMLFLVTTTLQPFDSG